jgi:PPM family protein phosphatase
MLPSTTKVEIAARTDRGKVRKNNEDAFLVFRTGRFLERLDSSIPEEELPSRFDQGGYIMAVADGMGGMAAGEVASRKVLLEAFRLILKAPKWLLSLDDLATRETEIQAFFDRTEGYLAGMNAALFREMAADPSKTGMGTTLTVAYSVGLDLFIVHVGDSRAYLLRQGDLRRITHDHTVAQRLADVGTISQKEVARHPQRNVLTRVIGGSGGWQRGETHHVRLEPMDRLLLCTDGLPAALGDEEIAKILAGEGTCERICETLLDLTLSRGAPDNATMVVARYDAPDPEPRRRSNRPKG